MFRPRHVRSLLSARGAATTLVLFVMTSLIGCAIDSLTRPDDDTVTSILPTEDSGTVRVPWSGPPAPPGKAACPPSCERQGYRCCRWLVRALLCPRTRQEGGTGWICGCWCVPQRPQSGDE
jgi:hypothetical protein